MTPLEAFDRYCHNQGITSEQYILDIWPVYAAGFTAGMKSARRTAPEECDIASNGKTDAISLNLSKRGNPAEL